MDSSVNLQVCVHILYMRGVMGLTRNWDLAKKPNRDREIDQKLTGNRDLSGNREPGKVALYIFFQNI